MGIFDRLFGKKDNLQPGKNSTDQKASDKVSTETFRVSGNAAIYKITSLFEDKSVRCFSIMDGGKLLAKAHPGMAQKDIDYILMCTRFQLSNVSPTISIVVERVE